MGFASVVVVVVAIAIAVVVVFVVAAAAVVAEFVVETSNPLVMVLLLVMASIGLDRGCFSRRSTGSGGKTRLLVAGFRPLGAGADRDRISVIVLCRSTESFRVVDLLICTLSDPVLKSFQPAWTWT